MKFESTKRVLKDSVENGEIAGAVALIARYGQLKYHKAFGMKDLETFQTMQLNDIFRIGSMSKAITVVAAMKLYEEGHFKLEDSLSDFIPAFKDMSVLVKHKSDFSYSLEKIKSPIKIKHLFNHTSGLTYDYLGQPYISELYSQSEIYNGLGASIGSIKEMVSRLSKLPLINHPGERWQYGMNTDVLGYLIEVISGLNLDQFLKQNIFEPLQMIDTHFYLPQGKMNRMASLYGINSLGKLEKIEKTFEDSYHTDFNLNQKNKNYFSGGAGLLSTTIDYFKFLQMLIDKGSYKNQRIIRRSTVELLLSKQIRCRSPWLNGQEFGFGFSISKHSKKYGQIEDSDTLSWHGYFNTHFWANPNTKIVSLLFTQLSPYKHDLSYEFKESMYRGI